MMGKAGLLTRLSFGFAVATAGKVASNLVSRSLVNVNNVALVKCSRTKR